MVRERDAARQARRTSAISKLTASRDAGVAAAGAETAAAPVAPAKPAAPAIAAKPVETAKPVEAKTTEPAKPAEPSKDDDAETKRGLAQIEHARKRFLDERSAKEEEISRREARIAQRENEITGKASSIEELKKLDLATLLDRLGLDDAALTRLSRESYHRTAEGQKNPASKAAVDEVRNHARASTLEQQVAELRRELAETKESATAAQKLVFQREYANEWVDGALKAVPTDKPTLFGLLQTKNPREARNKLLALGGELEKSAGGDAPPTATEVLAEYEKRRRDELEAQGIDVERLLTPAEAAKVVAAAPVVKPTGRTLAVSETQITRADTVPQTKEERRANAIAKLRIRQRQTADEVS